MKNTFRGVCRSDHTRTPRTDVRCNHFNNLQTGKLPKRESSTKLTIANCYLRKEQLDKNSGFSIFYINRLTQQRYKIGSINDIKEDVVYLITSLDSFIICWIVSQTFGSSTKESSTVVCIEWKTLL